MNQNSRVIFILCLINWNYRTAATVDEDGHGIRDMEGRQHNAFENSDRNRLHEYQSQTFTEKKAHRKEGIENSSKPDDHNEKSEYGYLHEYLENVSEQSIPEDIYDYRARGFGSPEENITSTVMNEYNTGADNAESFMSDEDTYENLEIGYKTRKNILSDSEEVNAQLKSSRDHLYKHSENSANGRSSEYRKYESAFADGKYHRKENSFHNLTVEYLKTSGCNFREAVQNLSRADLIKTLNRLEHLKRDVAEQRSKCRQQFQTFDESLKQDENKLNDIYNFVAQKLYEDH